MDIEVVCLGSWKPNNSNNKVFEVMLRTLSCTAFIQFSHVYYTLTFKQRESFYIALSVMAKVKSEDDPGTPAIDVLLRWAL